MNNLTNQEIQFLIDICKEKSNLRYHGIVSTANTNTHTVDVYFIQNKLEKLKTK